MATLTMLSSGACTLLVDQGRSRSRSLGVPVGGAADLTSLALGNALVGNAPETAALEVSLAGPTLVADVDLACVVFGAPFEIWTLRRRLRAGRTFTLLSGEELFIGGTPSGMRAYLCIRGGVGGPLILDSRSSLQPLTAGTMFPCEEGHIVPRSLAEMPFEEDNRHRLRYLPGAQADWFPADTLSSRTMTVTPSSNRMGLRLQGEPLPVTGREMVSEPVCPGTVQVTRDGQCIVLGVDGQTIGGYPKIAHVIAADLDKLGQLRPGASVTFSPVSMEEATCLYRQKATRLKEWLIRIQMTTR